MAQSQQNQIGNQVPFYQPSNAFGGGADFNFNMQLPSQYVLYIYILIIFHIYIELGWYFYMIRYFIEKEQQFHTRQQQIRIDCGEVEHHLRETGQAAQVTTDASGNN